MQPRVVHWSADRVELAEASVATVGVFDGLHLGHQALIGETVAAAAATGVPAACVTFFPSPEVIFGRAEPRYLLLPDERAEMMAAMGVDLVLVTRFQSALAALDAADFMALLCDALHPRQVWVGDDFALGAGRRGNAGRLAQLGRDLGYELRVLPRFRVGETIVSSSLIRALVSAGSVEKAATLLGRPYGVRGRVVHGFGRGHELGFPTANLSVPLEKLLPADGVYAVKARVGGRALPAVASIGLRPTFGVNERAVEVHLIDYAADLYDVEMEIDLLARLREERRFSGAAALTEQMGEDLARARVILAAPECPQDGALGL